jgi:hypothetical protein
MNLDFDKILGNGNLRLSDFLALLAKMPVLDNLISKSVAEAVGE